MPNWSKCYQKIKALSFYLCVLHFRSNKNMMIMQKLQSQNKPLSHASPVIPSKKWGNQNTWCKNSGSTLIESETTFRTWQQLRTKLQSNLYKMATSVTSRSQLNDHFQSTVNIAWILQCVHFLSWPLSDWPLLIQVIGIIVHVFDRYKCSVCHM